jgi:chromosome segregation ATPase
MAKSNYVTFEDLVRFHQEVIAPDLDRRMDERLASMEDRFEARMRTYHLDVLDHFDRIYKRFDSIAVEYTAWKAGLKRVEERLDTIEQERADATR